MPIKKDRQIAITEQKRYTNIHVYFNDSNLKDLRIQADWITEWIDADGKVLNVVTNNRPVIIDQATSSAMPEILALQQYLMQRLEEVPDSDPTPEPEPQPPPGDV